MCAVVSFQYPYPMRCPLYGKTLVKKPVTLNVYKQKSPREEAICDLIFC